KVSDGDGLYLEVTPNGKGRWRFRYRFSRKEQMLSLGLYPAVSLRQARDRVQEMRRLLAQGINPSEQRKEELAVAENAFEVIAREWHSTASTQWESRHTKTVLSRLEQKVFPFVGAKPIREITSPELHQVMKRMEMQEKYSTAHDVLAYCTRVFQHAILTGRAEHDPAAPLKGALVKAKVEHRAGITDPSLFAALLRCIDEYQGESTTLWALQLAPLVFVRPGELRKMLWTEVDFSTSTWIIPAEKMKMRRDHIVPLARQAVEILERAHELNGQAHLVFPSVRSKDRPMSDNTLNAALRRLGYTKQEMCAHGFRASARTILDEVLHQRPELIEHQLAHAVRGPLGRAYNRTEFLEERRAMMQVWANYLDDIKEGGKVIRLPVRAG
ncbi:MAG: integrase arm-type DNA-binding domain-containing protein, partial [Deltaproteobacteria bacterium]|nr:integrase arm-type DNA-binding domain-containing protein [Deltaproteobacteria bacterium]